MSAKKEILYFDKGGPENTKEAVEAVVARAVELDIKHVVVASTTGATAKAFHDALKDKGVSVVCVTMHAGWKGGDGQAISADERKKLEEQGIQVVMCSHALSGVNRSISSKFGSVSRVEMISNVLRLTSQGLKVSVEVAIMATDAGVVPTDKEIITVGGTGSGADTAIVLQAAHQNNFFDLDIREIVAMPRKK